MCQTCLRVLCNNENLVIHADVVHTWDWRDDAGDEEWTDLRQIRLFCHR